MTTLLDALSFLDEATFVPPAPPAKADAVRKLATRLADALELGENAANTIAQAAMDPAAVRQELASPLPGLTAVPANHLVVLPARIWTPWARQPADAIARLSQHKITPMNDPSLPALASVLPASRDGLAMRWDDRAARDFHLADNRRIYTTVRTGGPRVRLFPEKGGIVTPLIMIPQTEEFADGSEPEHTLRLVDGMYRYLAAIEELEGYAEARLQPVEGVEPDLVRRVLGRDRSALLELAAEIRRQCSEAQDAGIEPYTAVHHLASALTLPALVVVGTADTRTGEISTLGAAAQKRTLEWSVSIGLVNWHDSEEAKHARLIALGLNEEAGLVLPQAGIDEEILSTARQRLAAREVPERVLATGFDADNGVRDALRLAWWCRAARELGTDALTAVAGFARACPSVLPAARSRAVIAVAEYLVQTQDTVYPPGDYRRPGSRPDGLELLVADAASLAAVAALSSDGSAGLLAHPRLANAEAIALAHLALTGALDRIAHDVERIEQVAAHTLLLAEVAQAWAQGREARFIRPNGGIAKDAQRQPVPLDARAFDREDLPWPSEPAPVRYLLPSSAGRDASGHTFMLRREVVFTVPTGPLGEDAEEPETLEEIAASVRRWFPEATGVVFTDWDERYIRGVMVGSVFLELFEHGHAGGRPVGTGDVVDFDSNAWAPFGVLLREEGPIDTGELSEAIYYELDEHLVYAADRALMAWDADQDSRHPVPVLLLPGQGK